MKIVITYMAFNVFVYWIAVSGAGLTNVKRCCSLEISPQMYGKFQNVIPENDSDDETFEIIFHSILVGSPTAIITSKCE